MEDMDFFDALTLFGGLAMFLYGMRLMGDSLKESSSGALKLAMEQVTNNPFKAFLLGLLITAVIQSSTATIVITSGLVGAGILTLHQSLGIIIGANVGTTVTGQIIRLLDLDAGSGSVLRLFQPSSLAPIALIAGIILIMAARAPRAKSIGNIAIGFGILFSGLLNMTGAVNQIAQSGIIETLFQGLGSNPILGYLTGAGVAFVLQSSSATIGILQAFSASGSLTFKAIYAVIVGIYLGDCVTTAIVCSIGAEPEARRVGLVNILFNLSETVLVLGVVAIVSRFGLLDWIWNQTVDAGIIANTNTIFNLSCAFVCFPIIGQYEKISRKLIGDEPETEDPYRDTLDALNPVFFETPALALKSCYDVLLTMLAAARKNIDSAVALLETYDEKDYGAIKAEEQNINRLTDRASRYMVNLLSNLKEPYHVGILDQYYKVVAELEHLGDLADDIADTARDMQASGTAFSGKALKSIHVTEELLHDMLDQTDLAFRRRNLEAAYRIDPMVDVVQDMLGLMKEDHLKRMSSGECNVLADAAYTSVLQHFQRIADTCSNIGEATVTRIRPELADHQHNYFSLLRSGKDDDYNAVYDEVKKDYFTRLRDVVTE